MRLSLDKSASSLTKSTPKAPPPSAGSATAAVATDDVTVSIEERDTSPHSQMSATSATSAASTEGHSQSLPSSLSLGISIPSAATIETPFSPAAGKTIASEKSRVVS